jgi:transcriptional regulator with XRE-family HTH domain
VGSIARMAGLRATTVSSWWTKGHVPDNASLRLLAEALGVELADLVAAYDGSEGRTWVFSDSELEALVERAVDRALIRHVAERGGDDGAELRTGPINGRRDMPAEPESAAPRPSEARARRVNRQ